MFWSISDSNNAEKELIFYIESWEKEKQYIFHYNFSLYIKNKSGNVTENSEFKKFFDFYSCNATA